MKTIVLFKEGFEELEALSVVDVLRRGRKTCEMVGMDSDEVKGSRDISVKMDRVFDESVYDADVVVLPGGLPGAVNLLKDERVIALLKDFDQKGKWIAAICAGPMALGVAGIMQGKKFTCYPGFEQQVSSSGYQATMLCEDGHIITAKGPAAALKFAYLILDKVGGDSKEVADGMLYDRDLL